jgi:arylsulfatase A-like enzyme
LRRALAAAVALGIVALALLWPRGEFQLPARMPVEELVADLGTTLDHATVVAQRADAPVRIGGLTPGHGYEVNGVWRRALLASPPSLVRFRVHVPPDARLHFGVAVPRPEDRSAARVRFAVTLDGREVFARDVDPGRRRDRGWLDHDIDLGAAAGREVEVGLTTSTAGSATVRVTPAWSHVRVVRRTWRDRQAASMAAPSVLVLLVDTLRADRLGCYGARPSPSPNLDRLAERALVFEQAIAQSSWTVPSVATLFTGLHPRSHGAWLASHDDTDGASDVMFLPDSLPTLAGEAQRAGITTVAVSANPLVSHGTNFAQGFETFVEFGMESRERPDGKAKDWAPAADVDAKFLAWLRRNRGRRFLAYLHYMEPHDPYTPRGERPPPPPGLSPALAHGEVFDAAQRIDWHGGAPLPEPVVAWLRQLYDGEIRGWDDELGRLLPALDALGVRDSTVVVVTADHGEEFQEHGKLRHGADLYDETLHVPLLIAGPGVVAGRVAEQVQGIDLFPTVAALLGFAAPPAAPGRNVLVDRDARPAYSELGELTAVRTLRWKLIAAPGSAAELYDLEADAGERRNRFGTAAAGETLTQLLATWRATAPAPPAAADRDPQIVEKLRALGYVE